MKLGSNMTVKAKSITALIFACLAFGLSFMFSKRALNVVSPFVLLAFRFSLAFILLNILVLTKQAKISLKGKKKYPLIVLGVFQPVIYFICENYGLSMTGSTLAAVMIALIPIASLFGGILFLNEIPSVWQVFFMLISLGGIVIMALQKNSEGTASLLGILLLALAVVAQVIFSALSRKFSNNYTPFERTYFMFLVGTMFFVPAALIQQQFNAEQLVASLLYPEVISAVLFLGIFCSVGAFLAINYAATYLPVARTAVFANMTTLVSVFAGVLFLKETFNYIVLVTTAMIVIGVWGVQKFSETNGLRKTRHRERAGTGGT
jgi:drug/metabolite transporter (DMT)-like permease